MRNNMSLSSANMMMRRLVPNRGEIVQLRAISGKNSNVPFVTCTGGGIVRLVFGFSSTTPSGNVTSTQMIMSLGCGTVNLVGGFGNAAGAAAILNVKNRIPGWTFAPWSNLLPLAVDGERCWDF